MGTDNSVRMVSVGQKFSIDLEAMPGAGYMWEIPHTPAGIELLDQEVVSVSKAVGGPSTQRFTLVADQPGDYSLDFQFKRKWEKNPMKTNQVSVQAR